MGTSKSTTETINVSRCAPILVALLLPAASHSSAHADCSGEWTRRTPLPAPAPRVLTALAFDSSRDVAVLFGGSYGARLGDTWEFDGDAWRQKNPAPAPLARYGHAMAFDSRREVSVLFGGFDNDRDGETWEWNGSFWLQRFVLTFPTPRAGHAMAYDSRRGVTILFGGETGNNVFSSETWEWDGTEWKKRVPDVSPPARTAHAMVFDSARGVAVLFGGRGSAGPLDDTWEYDGSNWALRAPLHKPAKQSGHAMAYDSGRQVTVLFGDTPLAGSLPSAETWEWDGADWNRRTPAGSPSPREGHAMAFDSARGVSIAFGGDPILVPNDQHWEWAGAGPLITRQPIDQFVDLGGDVAFSITVDGDGPFAYSWRRNGLLLSDGGSISGSTTARLVVTEIGLPEYGDYTCRVESACGRVESEPATLANPLLDCATGMTPMLAATVAGIVSLRRRQRLRGR